MGGREKNGKEKLDFSKRSFTDEDLDSLPLRDVTYPYREVDFSQNFLSAESLSKIIALCKLCTRLRVLKLYKNGIRDAGARELAAFLRQSSTVEEVHLSHNHFSAHGVTELVEAAEQGRDTSDTPMWLRLENNDVEDPHLVLQSLQRCFSVCERRDQARCSVRVCAEGCKVHLPFFRFQRQTADMDNCSASAWEEHPTWQQDEWRCSYRSDHVLSSYQQRNTSRGRKHKSWDSGSWEYFGGREDKRRCRYDSDHGPSSYQRRDTSKGSRNGSWGPSGGQEDRWRQSNGTDESLSSYHHRNWTKGRQKGSWAHESKSSYSPGKLHGATHVPTHDFKHAGWRQHEDDRTRPGRSGGRDPSGGLFARAVGDVVGAPEDARSRSPPRGKALVPALVPSRAAGVMSHRHVGWKEQHKEPMHPPTLQPASGMQGSSNHRSSKGNTTRVIRKACLAPDVSSRDGAARSNQQPCRPRTRIRVTNIPLNLSAQDIAEAFQDEAGKVRLCELVDGIAMIEFFHAEDAAKAASFNEGELNGNIICARLEP